MSSEVVEEQPKSLTDRRTHILLVILLFAATFTVYWPALRGGVLWDDDAHITRSGLQSISGLSRIWFDLRATQQYYPVLHTAFWVEHHLWGDSTVGYHILNVVLHGIAACLFALILSQLSIRGAWVGAFLFALHPVAVESVAWISEQKNTLSAVFYLLAMLLYLRHDEKAAGEVREAQALERAASGDDRPRHYSRDYYIALACFVAALLSKSVTATLPAALLVIFWWKRGKLSWNRDVIPLLPWFGVGIAGGLLTAWVERRYVGAEGKDFSLTLLQRVLISGRDVFFYLQKLVWPTKLMFIYPRWDVKPSVWWQYLFPAGVIILLALAWLTRNRTRSPLAALLFFIGTLFPALGFFNAYPFIYSFVADHFQYLASLGIIALFVALCAISGGTYRRALLAGQIAIIMILGIIARMDAAAYRDSETLYRTTIARNPACWMCYNNLGYTLFLRGQILESVPLYNQALVTKPDYAEAMNNLGVLLSSQHLYPAAIARFEQALKIKPEYPDALNNLGNLLVGMDKPEEAEPKLQKALEIRPDYPEARLNLGAALFKLNRTADAIFNLKEAIRLKPNSAEAHGILGVAWYSSGQLAEARTELEQALRLNPNDPTAHRDLGEILWELGQADPAISEFQASLSLDPKDEESHEALAKVYAAKGRSAEAAEQYQLILQQKPNDPTLHSDYAILLERLKQPQDAVAQFLEAIRLKRDYAEAHYNLGLLFAGMGRRADAIPEFKLALQYDPKNAEAHDALGAAYYESGRYPEAITEFTETQHLKPDLPGLQGNLELARRGASGAKK